MPEFYERSADGMPSRWLERIRNSMALLTPEFSAGRTIQQYTEDHYLPAASGYGARAAKAGSPGAELLQWQQNIARGWDSVRFGAVQIETRDGLHHFRVEVFPGSLPADDLQVELYASPLEKGAAAIATMTACDQCKAPESAVIYSIQVAAVRPASDYTPRIVSYHPLASVPLEAGQILWQR